MDDTDTFLWGTATAGHQVEGRNLRSDWWAFEKATRSLQPSGDAARFFDHMESDLDAAAQLGTNAFRFSIEWSQLEPERGRRRASALERYDRLVDACLERELEPVVTLLHFVAPAWIRRRPNRGWSDAGVRMCFAEHVASVADALGDRVRWWVTVNEPTAQADSGWLAGVFPPGQRMRPQRARACRRALVQTHIVASRALRARCCRVPRVGLAKHMLRWQSSALDPTGAVREWGERFNASFVDEVLAIAPESLDWLGINYYTKLRADLVALARHGGVLRRRRGPECSDMGWEIAPAAFADLLRWAWRRWRLPLVVTENGIADAGDRMRASFVARHIEAARRARASGVDLRGYFYWSLLDNFEWHEGFWPRFGLLEVDYATQRRRVRESADAFSAAIRRARGHGM